MNNDKIENILSQLIKMVGNIQFEQIVSSYGLAVIQRTLAICFTPFLYKAASLSCVLRTK